MFPQKASDGIKLVFPDVCKVPAPPAPLPLPYPTFAQTAVKKQQKKVSGGVKKPGVSLGTTSMSPGTLKEVVSFNTGGPSPILMGARGVEVTQLKSSLNQLNSKVQALSSKDPNEWQKVLQEYLLMASALYVTLNSDDDD